MSKKRKTALAIVMGLLFLLQILDAVFMFSKLDAAGYESMKEYVYQSRVQPPVIDIFYHRLQNLYTIHPLLSKWFDLFLFLPGLLAFANFLFSSISYFAAKRKHILPFMLGEGLFAVLSVLVLLSVYVQNPLLFPFLLWVQITGGIGWAAWGGYFFLVASGFFFLWREWKLWEKARKATP